MNRFAALLISSPLIVATASGTPAPAPRADSRADLEARMNYRMPRFEGKS